MAQILESESIQNMWAANLHHGKWKHNIVVSGGSSFTPGTGHVSTMGAVLLNLACAGVLLKTKK